MLYFFFLFNRAEFFFSNDNFLYHYLFLRGKVLKKSVSRKSRNILFLPLSPLLLPPALRLFNKLQLCRRAGRRINRARVTRANSAQEKGSRRDKKDNKRPVHTQRYHFRLASQDHTRQSHSRSGRR